MSITTTVIQYPSDNPTARVHNSEGDTTVSTVLSALGISPDNQTIKSDGVELAVDHVLQADKLLTVTAGSKGNS